MFSNLTSEYLDESWNTLVLKAGSGLLPHLLIWGNIACPQCEKAVLWVTRQAGGAAQRCLAVGGWMQSTARPSSAALSSPVTPPYAFLSVTLLTGKSLGIFHCEVPIRHAWPQNLVTVWPVVHWCDPEIEGRKRWPKSLWLLEVVCFVQCNFSFLWGLILLVVMKLNCLLNHLQMHLVVISVA